MADIFHWWGEDLSWSPTGDLAKVFGLNKDNQRIFRRLCTNGRKTGAQIGEYIFHIYYGGSAPWYVGQTTNELTLESLMRTQMYYEASVGHDPEPIITPTIFPTGEFSLLIDYYNTNIKSNGPALVMDVTR